MLIFDPLQHRAEEEEVTSRGLPTCGHCLAKGVSCMQADRASACAACHRAKVRCDHGKPGIGSGLPARPKKKLRMEVEVPGPSQEAPEVTGVLEMVGAMRAIAEAIEKMGDQVQQGLGGLVAAVGTQNALLCELIMEITMQGELQAREDEARRGRVVRGRAEDVQVLSDKESRVEWMDTEETEGVRTMDEGEGNEEQGEVSNLEVL